MVWDMLANLLHAVVVFALGIIGVRLEAATDLAPPKPILEPAAEMAPLEDGQICPVGFVVRLDEHGAPVAQAGCAPEGDMIGVPMFIERDRLVREILES